METLFVNSFLKFHHSKMKEIPISITSLATTHLRLQMLKSSRWKTRIKSPKLFERDKHAWIDVK